MSVFKWIEVEVPTNLEVRQVYGFIFGPDGRILLLEDNGHYNLPGGKPENGESFPETLIREAEEEVQVTITSIEYFGYQLITVPETFAQVRLVAMVDEIKQAAPDPSTGRQYRRLWVPPSIANELLDWGESGNEQIAGAMTAISNLISNVNPEFTIRAAGIEDAPGIARVNYSTWLHAFRGLIPDLELDSLNLGSLIDQWMRELSATNSRGATLIALDDDSVIAYSRFYPSVDDDEDRSLVATIGSMYVSPKFQRRGVGRKLEEAVLLAAKERDFTEATLHVLAANQRAREFYENLGWEEDLQADIVELNEDKGSKVRYRKSLFGLTNNYSL